MFFNQGVQDISGSSDLSLLHSSHVTCRRDIVDPGNPVCSMRLQILVYSTVVHVVEGFPQFFDCPNKVISVVRPHLLYAASSPCKSNKLNGYKDM